MQLKIGYKIRNKCHISANRTSKEIIPYLKKIIFKNSVEMAAGIAKWLVLDDEMIDHLVENRKTLKPLKRVLNPI